MEEFGALVVLGYGGGRKQRKEKKSISKKKNGRRGFEREKKIFKFSFLFLIEFPSVNFWLEPMLPLILVTCSAKRREESGFLMLKACLGLCASSPVPVSRVSLHPSGPVFEGRQYISKCSERSPERGSEVGLV